jgi:excisionase family DNA binding protein
MRIIKYGRTPMTTSGLHAMEERARKASEAFDLITIKEAAEMLDKSVRTLRRWQAAGKMPKRYKHGRWLKYSRRELQELFGA